MKPRYFRPGQDRIEVDRPIIEDCPDEPQIREEHDAVPRQVDEEGTKDDRRNDADHQGSQIVGVDYLRVGDGNDGEDRGRQDQENVVNPCSVHRESGLQPRGCVVL